MPEVSVIIPAFNAAAYLSDAVDSALAQTFADIEILVVDDGSTDATEVLMRQYGPPVRYFRQANGGVASARNHGIAESRGRYVAFLDADDLWEADKLSRQLAALATAPERFKACYTAHLAVTANLSPLGVRRGSPARADLELLLTSGNVVGTPSSVVVERSLLVEQAGFDLLLSQCADWDLWVRLAALTEFLYLGDPLIRYRQHGGNMSRNVPLLEKDSLRVLEKGFAMPGLSPELLARRSSAFARNYMVLAGSYFQARRYRDFTRCASRALSLDLSQVRYLAGYPARLIGRLFRKPAANRV